MRSFIQWKKNKIPRMAFKLDISKAYDKVKWDFLYDVLERVGFNDKVINLIKMVVGSVQYYVLLNGPHGAILERRKV